MDVETKVNELLHYGVKGMKWGVRKDASRADKKWGRKAFSQDMHYRVQGRAADKINKALPGLNARHKQDGTTKKYRSDIEKLIKDSHQSAFREIMGSDSSPSGKYSAEVVFDWNTGWAAIQPVWLEHSDTKDWGGLQLSFDDRGFVIKVEFMKTKPIAHYGVKGMKWGVRRDKKSRSADSAAAAKLKRKRISEMSNAELTSVSKRLRLEQEYSRLNPTRSKKIRDRVDKTVGQAGQALLNKLIEQGATKAAEFIVGVAVAQITKGKKAG